MQHLEKIRYLKKGSLILIASFCLTSNSIHSQALSNIPKTDSTTVAYYRLNVYEQYRRGFLTQDTLILNLRDQIEILNNRIGQKDKLVFNYENRIIPKLENQIYLSGEDFDKQIKIQVIKEDVYTAQIKTLKNQKYLWGLVGTALGIIIAAIAF